ncbi:hypothetical protein NC239_14805 [Streptomyces sp. G3]|nr:hypothetical protein [Streptomyces sp. G3]MCM1939486.1 hypothetical protein [Streptomyces sp. G3]
MKIRALVPHLLDAVGVACLSTAAWLLHPVAGLAVAGVAALAGARLAASE